MKNKNKTKLQKIKEKLFSDHWYHLDRNWNTNTYAICLIYISFSEKTLALMSNYDWNPKLSCTIAHLIRIEYNTTIYTILVIVYLKLSCYYCTLFFNKAMFLIYIIPEKKWKEKKLK